MACRYLLGEEVVTEVGWQVNRLRPASAQMIQRLLAIAIAIVALRLAWVAFS